MEQIRIFVSHSHADVAYCRELVAHLRAGGADVWYDEDNLPEGELSIAIPRELPPRPIFVVVLSRAAFASQWVLKESIMANNLFQRDPSRIIVPVTAESFNPKDAFQDGWLILEDFKRIESPGFQPVPASEAAQKILTISQRPGDYYRDRTITADQLVTLGIGFRDQGRYPEAIDQFLSATKLDAQSFPAWRELAKLQLRVQQPENALQSVDRALAIRVDDFDALQTKIDILDALRLYADKEVYQHLLENTKALALMKGKKPSEQEKLSLINAWFQRIHCLVMLGRFQEVLALHERDNPIVKLIFDFGIGAVHLNNYARLLECESQALQKLGKTAEAQQRHDDAEFIGAFSTNLNSTIASIVSAELDRMQQCISRAGTCDWYLWREFFGSYELYPLKRNEVADAALKDLPHDAIVLLAKSAALAKQSSFLHMQAVGQKQQLTRLSDMHRTYFQWEDGTNYIDNDGHIINDGSNGQLINAWDNIWSPILCVIGVPIVIYLCYVTQLFYCGIPLSALLLSIGLIRLLVIKRILKQIDQESLKLKEPIAALEAQACSLQAQSDAIRKSISTSAP